jgi:D-glycero-D-manno-heptose 1,7-bisphosphate phosphatase
MRPRSITSRPEAVFLDRDGVLVEDRGPLADPDELELIPGAARALRRLRDAGLALVAVSNQAVVARGLADEAGIETMNRRLDELLVEAGGPRLDRHYFCPHHPEATLPAYRLECDCRKPRPGMILAAARDLGLDPAVSFMVGDRPTDIAAGTAAGCSTILVHSGRHREPPIVTSPPQAQWPTPDHECADLAAAAEWILAR